MAKRACHDAAQRNNCKWGDQLHRSYRRDVIAGAVVVLAVVVLSVLADLGVNIR